MSTREFRLPDLGEGLTESDIVSWRVAAGDTVELNQIIAEVETAKALVELPSPFAGVVARLHAEAGQTVNVGAPLVTFEVEGDEPVATPALPQEVADDDEPEPNLVGYGAGPERGGHPVRRARKPAASASALTPVPTGAVPASAADAIELPERPRSTPPVRKFAADLGVDLAGVRGTGPDGLVTRSDVEAAAAGADPVAVEVPRSATADRRIPIKGVRKHTAAAMVASAFTAPHVAVWTSVDVTPTMELLDHLAADRAIAGTRITVLTIIARAVCLVLRQHPELNSSWDEAAQEIIHHGAVNLGIAAATERGLVVPNIKDAGSLGLVELAVALGELTAEARSGRMGPQRLAGGTFTITNIGVFGVEGGTPILNPGEAGILAVGAVTQRPWEHEGQIALRQVMTLTLSIDHRIVDGEQGSRFLAAVAAVLADPGRALLYV